MAGGFAHMTLVDTLSTGDALAGMTSLTDPMRESLELYKNFLELGSVSPDYPYLALFDSNAEGWANVMHYWHTMDVVRNAVPLVHAMKAEDGDAKLKCTAWLFGYLAHVVTDYAVHPVVFLKVGAYAQHKIAHRVCELNEDVYIYHAIFNREIDRDSYLDAGGITSCCKPSDRGQLEPAVAQLWKQCLPPLAGSGFGMGDGVAQPTAAPDPEDWHRHYVQTVDEVVAVGGRLPFLSRHIGEDAGIVYPRLSEIDRSYIENLKTPEGLMAYDAVFQRSQEAVKSAWAQLGRALDAGDAGALTIPDGDLDTGRDGSGRMIVWKEQA